MQDRMVKIVLLLFLFAFPFSSWGAQSDTNENQAQQSLQVGLDAARRHDYKAALSHFLDARRGDPDSPQILFDAGLASANLPGYEMRSIALFKAYLIEAPDASNAGAVRKQIALLEERFEGRMRQILDRLQSVLTANNDLPLEEWYSPDDARLRRGWLMTDGWYLAAARYFMGDAKRAQKGLRATNGKRWREGWSSQWKGEAAHEHGEKWHYDSEHLVAAMASSGLLDDALDLMDRSFDAAPLPFFLEQGDLSGARKIASFGGKDGWQALAFLAACSVEPGDVAKDDDNHQILRAATDAGVDNGRIDRGSCGHDLWWSQSRLAFLTERGTQGVRLNNKHDDTAIADFVGQATAESGSMYEFNSLFSGMAELAREYRKVKGPASREDDAPEAYYYQGKKFAGKGQHERAIADFSKAIESNPKDLNAYYSRGLSHAALKQWVQAISDYGKVLKLDRNNVEALSARAFAYEAKGEPEKAIADYDEVMKLNPDDARAHYKRGTVYEAKGMSVPADADFGKAAQLDGTYSEKYAEILSKRGDAHEARGEHELAIADYSRSIEMNSDILDAFAKRADAYEAMGQHDLAIADYSFGIKGDPDWGYAYLSRGDAYRAKGEADKAFADYAKALELVPKDDGTYTAYAYTGRGSIYYDRGDYDRALADFNRAIELDPKGAYAFCNRGLVYYQTGQFDRAIADFSQALTLDPTYGDASTDLQLANEAKRLLDQFACSGKAIEANPQDVPRKQ